MGLIAGLNRYFVHMLYHDRPVSQGKTVGAGIKSLCLVCNISVTTSLTFCGILVYRAFRTLSSKPYASGSLIGLS
jgi:hypothetical protein